MISFLLLVSGTALCARGLNATFQTFARDIASTSQPDPLLDPAMTRSGLVLALGSLAAILGIIGFVLSLMAWIQNAPPGSRFTHRGWDPTSQLTEAEISATNARVSIVCGICGTLGWTIPLYIEAFRSLPLSSSLATAPAVLALFLTVIGYGSGINFCWRRDRHAAATAQGMWTLAFIVNFGGFLIFLFAGSTLFLVHSHI